MDCSNVKAQLFNFEENLLSGDIRQNIEDHLQTCRECSGELQSIRQYSSALKDIARPAPPPDFLPSIREQLENKSVFKKILNLILFPGKNIPVRFAGIAATLAIVVTVYITVYNPLQFSKKAGETVQQESVFQPTVSYDQEPEDEGNEAQSIYEEDEGIAAQKPQVKQPAIQKLEKKAPVPQSRSKKAHAKSGIPTAPESKAKKAPAIKDMPAPPKSTENIYRKSRKAVTEPTPFASEKPAAKQNLESSGKSRSDLSSSPAPSASKAMKKSSPMGKISARGNRQLKEKLLQSERAKMLSGSGAGASSPPAESEEFTAEKSPEPADKKSVSPASADGPLPLQAGGRQMPSAAQIQETKDPSDLSVDKMAAASKPEPAKLINLVLIKRKPAVQNNLSAHKENLPEKVKQFISSRGGKILSESKTGSSVTIMTELPYNNVPSLLTLLGKSSEYSLSKRPALTRNSGTARIRLKFEN